jgi:hypothetical protein
MPYKNKTLLCHTSLNFTMPSLDFTLLYYANRCSYHNGIKLYRCFALLLFAEHLPYLTSQNCTYACTTLRRSTLAIPNSSKLYYTLLSPHFISLNHTFTVQDSTIPYLYITKTHLTSLLHHNTVMYLAVPMQHCK